MTMTQHVASMLRSGRAAYAALPFRSCRPAHMHYSTRAQSTSTQASQPEMCVIVDEHNNVVGAKPRAETVRQRLLGRGAYVLVLNEQGELLVSKRTITKDIYPGALDVVVAGIVRAGEEYHETAARELNEELGIPYEQALAGLHQLSVFPYQDQWCQVWGCAFAYTHDRSASSGPSTFSLQAEEVEWVNWVSLPQVMDMLQNETFTPVGRHILGLHGSQLLRP